MNSTAASIVEPDPTAAAPQEVHREGLFHRPQWERVFGVYGLPYQRATVQRGGRIVGALPLVCQKSPVFGRQLVSLPWFDAAGIAAEDAAARRELIERALETAEVFGAKVVQLRQSERLDLSPHERTDKVVQRLRLEADSETLWNRFKASVRNQVRKAEKSGLAADRGGGRLLDEFFTVYSRNMRDLGSPSHSRRFFEAVLQAFPDESRIYVVRHGEKAVGGGLTLADGATLEIPWASSLREYNGHCVNHAMYWRILEDACREGFEWFSFGRSTAGSGAYRYKKQWGTEEVTLHWYFLCRREEDAAAAAVPPQEKFRTASRLWQKLPLWLSRPLGPKLIARLP